MRIVQSDHNWRRRKTRDLPFSFVIEIWTRKGAWSKSTQEYWGTLIHDYITSGTSFCLREQFFVLEGGEIMTLTWPWFGNRRVKFDLIDYKTKWCLFDCLKILWIFYYDKYKKTLSLKENLKPGLSNCCCMYRVSGSYKNIEIGSDMTCVDVIREALQKFGVEVSL